MTDIYKEIGKIFTKDAEYKYRGYILSKRGGSSSATAVATEELIKKAEEKGLKIKTRLIGPRNFPIKDMKNMVDRELLAVGLNQEFTKDSKFKMEISPKAIENLSDNGFSGIAIVKNNKGEVVKRKGFSGATAEQVKRLANEWFKENKIFTNDSNKYDEWINYSEKNLTRVKEIIKEYNKIDNQARNAEVNGGDELLKELKKKYNSIKKEFKEIRSKYRELNLAATKETDMKDMKKVWTAEKKYDKYFSPDGLYTDYFNGLM